MGGAIGLAAYRALSGRGAPPALSPVAERPLGELLWMHAAEPGSSRSNLDLARELVRQRDGLNILLTSDEPQDATDLPGVITDRPPVEHPGATAAFMRHWSPDMSLWIWGGLRPNLVLSAAALGNPIYLVDVGQDAFDQLRKTWLPEVPRQLLTHFSGWLARSEAARSRLAEYGVNIDRIEKLAPLRALGQTLPAAESDQEDLRSALSGRPVWFARNVGQDELKQVLDAHQSAMRITPRLFLVIEPAEERLADGMSQFIEAQNLRHLRWSEGEMPTESTQILLADLSDEAGLWYRLSSVAFLGQSFQPSGPSCDPFEAAAHGSAILFGPKVNAHTPYYARLSKAGAARTVQDSHGLASSIVQLLAPDQAARMAMTAWDLVTEGAEAANRITELVQATLDDRVEGRD